MPDRLVVDLGVDGQATVLSWPDGGIPEEVSRTPLTWPLDVGALEDLRWYLEDYLLAPYGAWEVRGGAIREKLPGWGDEVFGSIFGAGPARFAYERARDHGLEMVFRSADPGRLALPWELMRDGSGPVALAAGGVSRSLPVADGASTLDVPGGQLRVLMVISRPAGDSDVSYQMVARPLLKRLNAVRGKVTLTVLRPPTFEALREMVRKAANAGEPYHVVHFDGHGAMPERPVNAWSGGGGPGGGRPPMLAGPVEGILAFEKPGGGSDHVGAAQVAQVLAEGKVPVVVLNACQSGAVGKELEASVATALLKAGCAAVVAMAYSVYAVAAAEFMAAFYESLFAGESVGQAVTTGRRRLFERDDRPSPKGDMPLADWLVPVHYLRREVRFPQARTARPAATPSLDEALNQIRSAPAADPTVQDPFAAVDGVFVGRDDLFYQLETAARLQHVVILTGPGGTGKTELAKGFARWWRDTGGIDDPRLLFWHSFEPGVAAFGLDGVINGLGLDVFGSDFARLGQPQRLEAVKQLLAEYRALLVWDNFESVKEMPDPSAATPPLDAAASTALKEFLEWVRDHSKSTVLITSRTQEHWLGQVRRIHVGGLNRAEAIEYVGYLLGAYPRAQARRDRRSFGDLLDWLDGHPLAMRLTLPRLDTTDPADLLSALRGTVPMSPADTPDADRTTSLAASITYSYAHLDVRTRRVLPAVSLFHGVADADVLAALSAARAVPGRFAGITTDEWSAVLDDAVRVGLLTSLGAGMYQLHPALPGYLAAGWQAENPSAYDQERKECEQALCTACAAFGTWLDRQIQTGDAAFAFTLIGRQRATLGAMLGHALGHRTWAEAESIVRVLDAYWDSRGLSAEAAGWSDRILDATASRDPGAAAGARSLWLHVTIRQADRQQAAGRLDEAAQAYRGILAYLQDQPVTDWIRENIGLIEQALGQTAQARGRLAEAEGWYRRSLAVKEERGDRPGLAVSYHQLGIAAQDSGRPDEAESWYRRALGISEELGNLSGMSAGYHQLGRIAQVRGLLAEAEDWYRRSLDISEELGDRPGMSASYHQLGWMAHDRGLLAEAEDWYRRSLDISEELGDRPGIAVSYHQLGRTAQVRGRLAEAEDWYRRALALEEELGSMPEMAMTSAQLALLFEQRRQPHEALAWMIRGVTLFPEFPHPITDPVSSHLARLTQRLGLSALEKAWQEVTGQPVPQAVCDYITSHHDEQKTGKS